MPSWPGQYRYDPPSSGAIQTEAEDAASAQDKGPARMPCAKPREDFLDWYQELPPFACVERFPITE
jgi:hypothetical protein